MLSKNELIAQLRERLRMVNKRINERTQQELNPRYELLAGGALMELRSEAGFLASLIADIEREGVKP